MPIISFPYWIKLFYKPIYIQNWFDSNLNFVDAEDGFWDYFGFFYTPHSPNVSHVLNIFAAANHQPWETLMISIFHYLKLQDKGEIMLMILEKPSFQFTTAILIPKNTFWWFYGDCWFINKTVQQNVVHVPTVWKISNWHNDISSLYNIQKHTPRS